MKSLKAICGAAILAGAIALAMQTPAEAQGTNATQLAASGTKADSAVIHKSVRQIKSTRPSKRRRCTG